MHARDAMLHGRKLRNGPKNISMAHTGSTFAPNAALGNGVPSLATVKASIDARRPQGCRAGAAAAPAPAPPPSPASAWLRPRGAAQPSRGRGCTAQQVAGCADGWCCEHRCHAGGACVSRERCVCATAHASARMELAPALHVGASSID